LSLGAAGEFPEGERSCEQAFSLARSINHLYSIGVAEYLYGLFFSFKGDGENTVKHERSAVECFEKSQVRNVLPAAWGALGTGYHLLGELDAALESVGKALKMQTDTGLSFFLSYHHCTLSGIHLDLGTWQEARLHAEEALTLARTNHERHREGQAWILLGRVIGKTEPWHTDTAKEHILQGMKIYDELKMKPSYASGYLALGELYAGTGQREKAHENLAKAQAMFEEMGMDYYLARTKKLLESLGMQVENDTDEMS